MSKSAKPLSVVPRVKSNESQLEHILDAKKYVVCHIQSDQHPAYNMLVQQETQYGLCVELLAGVENEYMRHLQSFAEPETIV